MQITIRKHGWFYHVFDDDCYILYYLFDYKIINRKTGFPLSSLNKVINKLTDLSISYEVIEEGKRDFKKLNKYSKYLKLGISKYDKDNKYLSIYSKLDSLDDTDLDKILEYIDGIINEKWINNC